MENKKVVQKIVLGGVIIKKNKILILQRNKDEDVYPGMWELPSGKREPLEPSNESLIREVKEETGLLVKPVMPVSVFDYRIEKPDEIRDSTQINFLVEIIGDETIKISSEHQNFAWVDEKSISKYDLSASTKKVIVKAFETASLIGK